MAVLGPPVTLRTDTRVFFHHDDAYGFVMPAGAVVREEIRSGLPRGERVVVQYGYVAGAVRYWVAAEALDGPELSLNEGGRHGD